MSNKVRINRFLANAGLGSRRKCEGLIRSGLVQVNGIAVDRLGMLIDPVEDSVVVEGRSLAQPERRIVLVLDKPEGVLCTVTDSRNRQTVIDIAREKGYMERIYPVGRLDLDTTGVLLLTNDGDLAYRLTHPRFKVEKTYRVIVEGGIEEAAISEIAAGIKLGGYVTRPCSIKVLSKEHGNTTLEVKIREGRKRQIRRMFAHFGHSVVKLRRVAIGDLKFDDLEEGEVRKLRPEEENLLRKLAGLA